MLVKGRVELKDMPNADFDGIVVHLQLPMRSLAFQKTTYVDHLGAFEFRVNPPPDLPDMDYEPKWRIVCAGARVVLDVEEGKPIDEVMFEITTRSRTEPVRPDGAAKPVGLKEGEIVDRSDG